MSTILKWQRVTLWLAGFISLAPACVRLSDHERYSCSHDSDCNSSEKCLFKYCAPRDYCESSIDCRASQFCENQKCIDPDCTHDDLSACASGNACVNGHCEPSCTEDYDCGRNAHCNFNKCVDGSRTGNADQASCDQNSDCESNVCCKRASGAVCAKSCGGPGTECLAAIDCLDPYCCATVNGPKVCSKSECPPPPCRTDAECGVGKVCREQACVNPPPPMINGAPCSRDGDCVSKSCVASKCQGTGMAGDSCESALDCEEHRPCCMGDVPGKTCGDAYGICRGPLFASCKSNTDCLSEYCYDQTFCSKTCKSGTDDCGTSAWGVRNWCDLDVVTDEFACLAGCRDQSDCDTHVPDTTCISVGANKFCESNTN